MGKIEPQKLPPHPQESMKIEISPREIMDLTDLTSF
jgi:hypothetical protein